MRHAAATILLLAFTPVLWADVVILKDGSRIEGDVKRNPAGYQVTEAGGKTRVLSQSEVKSIEVAPSSAGNEKLASLRRSVEFLDDLGKIIDRYQRFIEQNAGSAMEGEARKDLAMWRDRQQQALVKFNGRWITPAQRTALQEKALRQADAVRKLLKAGRLAEAETTINQTLAEDPQNAAALYLRGLLQFRNDQTVPARKSFEQVNVLVPRHGPTLNNLGVILSRQNQNPAALNYYDQAMTVAPKTKEILNNIAELLYAMPDEQRNSPRVQKLLQRFNEQDVALAKELEPQGLRRWGATWVTAEQVETLKKAEQDVQDKLDALAGQFDAVNVRITNIDRELDENDKAMRRFEAASVIRDSAGTLRNAVLPPTYYNLQDDSHRLGIERGQQVAKLEGLREQAKAINRELPVPKYSGIQKLMDENSAPIIAPVASAAPATQPATAPSP